MLPVNRPYICTAVVGIFGISRDITELKQAEQELIQYREHLEKS